MRILSLLLLIAIPGISQAQPERVAYIKSITGKSQVTRDGKTILLQMGSLIYNTDQLLVGKGSYLMLLGKTNRYYEILKPGKYTYADIEKKVEEKPTGITDKFFHLLWEDLIHHESGATVTGNKIGAAVGGPIRDLDSCITLTEPTNIYHTSADTIRFAWEPVKDAGNYGFILCAKGGREIMHIVTSDTSLVLLKMPLLNGSMSTYTWKVITRNRGCTLATHEFTLYNSEKETEKAEALASLVEKEDNPLIYYLRVSQVLAEQGWLSKSLEYYNKARSEQIIR